MLYPMNISVDPRWPIFRNTSKTPKLEGLARLTMHVAFEGFVPKIAGGNHQALGGHFTSSQSYGHTQFHKPLFIVDDLL